jgi:hypothetical protein
MLKTDGTAIEVQYHCPECDTKFVVYHRDDDRNTHCAWCNKPVKQTGRIRQIEGDEIVTYQDDVEVEREPKKA